MWGVGVCLMSQRPVSSFLQKMAIRFPVRVLLCGVVSALVAQLALHGSMFGEPRPRGGVASGASACGASR